MDEADGNNQMSNDQIMRAFTDLKDGIPMQDLASRFGCSTRTLRRRMRDLGLWLNPPKGKKGVK
jgi:transcriptional antiterminator